MNKIVFCIILFLTCGPFAKAQSIPLQIQIHFTNPQCASYQNKPKNAYCTRADVASNQKLVEKIVSQIKNPANTKITLASMTFSNKTISQALCEAARNNISVELLMDASANAEVAEQVSLCQAKLFTIGSVQQADERGDLHHNKFLMIERKNDAIIFFSSANFSNPGLSINHEIWGEVFAPINNSFIQDHFCLVDSLKDYQTGQMKRFSQQLQACKSTFNQQSTISSLFVPSDSKRLVDLLIYQIRTSRKVLMTSNRFSYPLIIQELNRSKSQDIRTIFDDDLYWGGVLTNSDDYKTESLDAERIKQLKNNIQVRYTQTSFTSAQKMHAKLALFDSLAIIGAGNFTSGGMNSNFENFYVITDRVALQQLSDQFEYLWSISTAGKDMPTDYLNP